MAYERGRQSRQTSTFMLPADVQAFDEVLGPHIRGIACWTTDTPELEGSVIMHRSLSEALIEGTQAFLWLTEDGTPMGPRLQYLPTDMVGGSWAGPSVDPETPNAFIRAGRLAYLWFPDDEPNPVRAGFVELAKVAWAALHAVTAVHLVQSDGKLARSTRIGSAAREWVKEHPSQQLVAWNTYMRLR
ncbi:hypothetical protein ACTOB_003475 [Actinoplanes oblitus]|uniref:Uncharacterized protein n=1 Tax=Actinoplanes oblitus TaxID=3040509 RepID=A0ABY8WV19_9ACTN|nr:hypothetical protein [Actinoplanes oblitus]WIM99810.1 hypothetical protein ACTOB_003475 [Actinoplanes oblitus]